jgi:hypothetical protein
MRKVVRRFGVCAIEEAFAQAAFCCCAIGLQLVMMKKDHNIFSSQSRADEAAGPHGRGSMHQHAMHLMIRCCMLSNDAANFSQHFLL